MFVKILKLSYYLFAFAGDSITKCRMTFTACDESTCHYELSATKLIFVFYDEPENIRHIVKLNRLSVATV